MNNLYNLSTSERISAFSESSTEASASIWEILRGRVKEMVGRVLRFASVPGAIRESRIEDSLTGQEIEIRVGLLFTRISVNGRDYYFNRLTGRFDGTGMGCR